MFLFEILFWFGVVVVAYTYFGFPLLVAVRAWLFPKPVQAEEHSPSVSVVVIAHNEEASIGDKIENLMQLDYPSDKLQIIVASDGSTDQTVAIMNQYANRGIMALDLPRQGKAQALNAAVDRAKGDILVFSDANSMFATDAIRQLAAPFADDQVGGVAGDQRYQKHTGQADQGGGERAYWNLDRALKRWESQAGDVISATGAIYAIRRRLFLTVPDGVTDDFITSVRVIQQGHRLVFAEQAAAYEPVAASQGIEFGRKVRVMTRGLRGVMMVRDLLNPFRHGFYSVQLFSHKVLRRLMVIPLILLFVVNAILATHSPVYAALFGLQVLFYSIAVVGFSLSFVALGSVLRGPLKIAILPAYFCVVNAAALVAFINTVRGRRIHLWEPQRAVEIAGSKA